MAERGGEIPRSPAKAGRWGALAAFFAIACALSWLDWGLVIASGRGWIPVRVPLNPWGSFGPAAAAVIVSAVAAGRAGLRELFAPLLRWRFGLLRWGVALLGPAALVALSVGLHAAAGGRVLPVAPVDAGQIVLLGIVLLFVGGPVGEEIGWRGYALPGLLERMGPVAASLVLAGMWAVWHLPLFWLPGAAQEGSSIPLFVAMVAACSILTTWVYLATSRSLLAAVLFHHSINLSTYFLPSFLPALGSARGFDRILLAAAWVAAGGAMLSMAKPARARTAPAPSGG